MKRALLVSSLLAGCGYGSGEGLYFETLTYESRTYCNAERCALAVGTSAEVGVAHWVSDTVEPAALETIEIDRPDLLEVAQTPNGLRMTGRAPGVAYVTVGQRGYTGPIATTQAIEIVDPAATYIVSYRGGRDAPEPDGRMRLLAGSEHVLLLERADAGGEALLGDYTGAWTTSSPAVTLAPTGETGVLQVIQVAEPTSLAVGTDVAQLPLDVVPATAVARLRVYVRERPHLRATDGQTIRLPERASFVFVIEAYDASGRFVAGRGAPGDVVLEGTDLLFTSVDRGFSPDPVDATVRIRVGAASMRVTLDYP